MHRLRPDGKGKAVISRVINALARAALMVALVAIPALFVPVVNMDGAQISLLIALLAGIFVFVEYFSAYPSLIEFRDGAPFNRMRFFMAALIVSVLTVLSYGTHGNDVVLGSAASIGSLMDVPFSPVRLLLIAMPNDMDLDMLLVIRDAAAVSYAIGLFGVGLFYLLVRVYDWPARKGAFNVWVNLPLFDPTTGGDVVPRLRRDGYINFVLGALLPFLIPAVVAAGAGLFDVSQLFESQSFVWSLTAWSFLPASVMMRGIAMCRIAELIEQKRARTYAQSAEAH